MLQKCFEDLELSLELLLPSIDSRREFRNLRILGRKVERMNVIRIEYFITETSEDVEEYENKMEINQIAQYFLFPCGNLLFLATRKWRMHRSIIESLRYLQGRSRKKKERREMEGLLLNLIHIYLCEFFLLPLLYYVAHTFDQIISPFVWVVW